MDWAHRTHRIHRQTECPVSYRRGWELFEPKGIAQEERCTSRLIGSSDLDD